MLKALLYASLFLGIILVVGTANPCSLLTTEYGSVCRCNSSYCDTVPSLASLSSGQYQLYSTSKSKLGFASKVGNFSNPSFVGTVAVTISSLSSTHQTILGFGGAFTDSTGINIASLPEAAQENLLQSYFGDDGIEYSLGRVPIGGTDFSWKGYTYCDEEDPSLSKFALQEADFIYKIPLIENAKKMRGNNSFQLFASAWSSPTWTKSNKKLNYDGHLLEEYYELWANYYLKFFDAYSQYNISFWGVTTQNEPYNSNIIQTIPNIGFSASQMIKWVTQYLGPAIRNSSYSDLKIILHDDQRSSLLDLKLNILSNDEVLKYADGIGVHWYTDFFLPASLLDLASSNSKNLFRLGTEACEGSLARYYLTKSVELGNWDRAESYLNSIIDDLKYDFVGWMDWNMALNETGGPTWIDNNVDSPIIVNATSGEFYKQPMFYALGHFSKFLVTGSIRLDVDVSSYSSGVDALAFQRPDGLVALILRNRGSEEASIIVNILGSTETFVLDEHSINTLLYSV